MTNPKPLEDAGFANERDLQEEGGRWSFFMKAQAVAAVSLLVGLTVACAAQEGSVVAVSEAGAWAPATVSAVPPATTPDGSSSPEIGSSAPVYPVRPEPEATWKETPEILSLPAPAVGPSAELPGGLGSALLNQEEPQPQPNILHVEVDGDHAVIISGAEEDIPLRGEARPEVPPPSKGERFIWHDGDRETPVWQDTLLVVSDVIPGVGWGDPSGPVFWSESNQLMALPGGVVLMLDPTWDAAAVDTFMRSNAMDPRDAKAFEGLINSFKVETDPGFPSLRLANSLAGQSGVIVSSPNWWIDEDVE